MYFLCNLKYFFLKKKYNQKILQVFLIINVLADVQLHIQYFDTSYSRFLLQQVTHLLFASDAGIRLESSKLQKHYAKQVTVSRQTSLPPFQQTLPASCHQSARARVVTHATTQRLAQARGTAGLQMRALP
jgi:hypothetical protein